MRYMPPGTGRRVLLPIKPATIEEALSYQTSMSNLSSLLSFAASLEANLPASQRVVTNLLRSNATNVTLLVPTNDAFSSLVSHAPAPPGAVFEVQTLN